MKTLKRPDAGPMGNTCLVYFVHCESEGEAKAVLPGKSC